MSIRSSPAGTAAAPQGDRLKTVLSAGLGRLPMHCTPCNDTMDQDDLVKNYAAFLNANMCQICFSPLAGPAQEDDSLPDALERVRASGNWYHRWCLAQWVWTNDTDPYGGARIQPNEIEDLLLFRPIGATVWPIPSSVAEERARVIAAVTDDGMALQFVSRAMSGDKEVVLAAVAQTGFALRHASNAMRGDKEVVLATVAQTGFALEFASNAMRGDKEVVLAAVAQTGFALRDASARLRGDKEVVLAAVTQDGLALEFASDEFSADKQVVLAAVTQDGRALRFASDALKNDEQVVKVAVRQTGLALEYASERLRHDKEVVLVADKWFFAAGRLRPWSWSRLPRLGV